MNKVFEALWSEEGIVSFRIKRKAVNHKLTAFLRALSEGNETPRPRHQ